MEHTVNMKQTEIFRILGDETRLRALLLIGEEKELCVCELVHALDISQPKISRHMATMREAGIVRSRRHAQWVFYCINPSLENWQNQIIKAALAGGKSESVAIKDKNRLARMKGRPDRCNVS